MVYLVAVSAVNGASLGPVVERRFLALITHRTQNFPCSGILDFWTFLTLSTHGTQARSSHSFDPRSDHTLSSRAIVKYLLMVPAVWSKAGAGGKLLLDAAVDPGGEVQLDVEPEREINISSGMKMCLPLFTGCIFCWVLVQHDHNL